jgi:hypothetical protein
MVFSETKELLLALLSIVNFDNVVPISLTHTYILKEKWTSLSQDENHKLTKRV